MYAKIEAKSAVRKSEAASLIRDLRKVENAFSTVYDYVSNRAERDMLCGMENKAIDCAIRKWRERGPMPE